MEEAVAVRPEFEDGVSFLAAAASLQAEATAAVVRFDLAEEMVEAAAAAAAGAVRLVFRYEQDIE